jgi:hypothetical protein
MWHAAEWHTVSFEPPISITEPIPTKAFRALAIRFSQVVRILADLLFAIHNLRLLVLDLFNDLLKLDLLLRAPRLCCFLFLGFFAPCGFLFTLPLAVWPSAELYRWRLVL